MVSFMISTDVWARGGKVVWAQGAYTRPEARRYNIMIKLASTAAKLSKKDLEVRDMRMWTGKTFHMVDLLTNKTQIGTFDSSKLFYTADIGKPNIMRPSLKL